LEWRIDGLVGEDLLCKACVCSDNHFEI
jgi:hypothetical protein